MKSTRIDAEEAEKRRALVSEIEALGADVSTAHIFIDDNSYNDFEYRLYKEALDAMGVTTSHLAREVGRATSKDRRSMERLFDSHFRNVSFSSKDVFDGCSDVREKIAKLATLAEDQLIMVYDNLDIEYAVRKYAYALLYCDIKDMNSILDQALGKPIEKKMTLTHTTNALTGLSTEELKALAAAQEQKETIEIEAEVLQEKGENDD